MSMSLNERNPHISVIPLGSRASSAAVVVPGIYFRKHSRIKSVYIVDRSGVSKSSSNYITFSLQDNASSPVVYASRATSDAAAVANTQLSLTLATPDDADTNHLEKDVPAGTLLALSVAGMGTAILTDAVALIEWYPV